MEIERRLAHLPPSVLAHTVSIDIDETLNQSQNAFRPVARRVDKAESVPSDQDENESDPGSPVRVGTFDVDEDTTAERADLRDRTSELQSDLVLPSGSDVGVRSPRGTSDDDEYDEEDFRRIELIRARMSRAQMQPEPGNQPAYQRAQRRQQPPPPPPPPPPPSAPPPPPQTTPLRAPHTTTRSVRVPPPGTPPVYERLMSAHQESLRKNREAYERSSRIDRTTGKPLFKPSLETRYQPQKPYTPVTDASRRQRVPSRASTGAGSARDDLAPAVTARAPVLSPATQRLAWGRVLRELREAFAAIPDVREELQDLAIVLGEDHDRDLALVDDVLLSRERYEAPPR